MILNISEAANLAIHALTYLAQHPAEQPVTTGVVARTLGASEAHLNKVLQRLKKAGLVNSMRGPGGGFSLRKNPEDINLKEIYEIIDGPLRQHVCMLGHSECEFGQCIFGDLLTNVHEQVDSHFSRTTLASFIESSAG
ncbi:MAG: Rrf2 family transcriptional regulator [bacterium]